MLALVLAVLPSFAPVAASLLDFHRTWAWSVLGNAVGRGALQIVDLDRDGRRELLAGTGLGGCCSQPGGYWYVLDYDGEFNQSWTSLVWEDALQAVRWIDDGETGLVVGVTGSMVRVFDAASKDLIRSFSLFVTQPLDVAIADVDGAPGLELVVCEQAGLQVCDFESGAQTAVATGLGCSSIDVGQADEDSAAELALAGISSQTLILDGATLEIEWTNPGESGEWARFGNFDADALDEVVVEEDNAEILRAWDPPTATMLWESLSGWDVRLLETADLDADGQSEVVVATRSVDSLRILDGATGQENWSLPIPIRGPSEAAIGDLDDDGAAIEVVIGSSLASDHVALIVVDTVGRAIEATSRSLSGPFRGLSIGNVDGSRGSRELVATAYRSEGGFGNGCELRFDLASGRMTFQGEWLPEPLVQDSIAGQLDDDPQLESCVTYGSGLDHYLRCEDGLSHEVEWEVHFLDYMTRASLTVAEIDGDPYPEILTGVDGSYVYAFEAESGWLKWRSQPLVNFATDYSVLRVANVDLDPEPEVIAGGGPTYSNPRIVIFEASTGLVDSGPYDVGATSFDIGDLEGNGALEIVVGTNAGTLAVLNPATGQLGPPLATLASRVVALQVGDVNRDGTADFVGVSDSRIQVHGGAEDLLIWTSPYLHGGAGAYDSLWITDVHSNDVPDLLVNTDVGIAVFEAPLFALFADGFETGDTSAWTATTP